MSNATDPLFGTAAELDAALGSLARIGGIEDGWDAVEHVVAEYKFREGTIPVIVLVQNQSGRSPLNTTLTHQGVLAAMESKGILFNVLIAGDAGIEGLNDIFDLAAYGATGTTVLGVEADFSDGIRDGQHAIHSTGVAPVQTTSDALQVSFDGSNTGATGMVGHQKSILFGPTASAGLGPNAAGYRATSVTYAAQTLSNPTVVINPQSSVNIPARWTCSAC